MRMDNVTFMDAALQTAEQCLKSGEVPVGCLFLYKNEIIASGRNTVNETRNATRHAELNCIDGVIEYCRAAGLDYNVVFRDIDVIVTVEPCIMCTSALHQLQVRSIVYGCGNDRFGGCVSVFDVNKVFKSNIPVCGGIKAEEAMCLLKDFYKGKNPNAPEHKVQKRQKSKIGSTI